jgi:hypothetical protein
VERDTGLEDADPPSTSAALQAPRPAATFRANPSELAFEFLAAVRGGDDRAVDLAARLAEGVLEASAARLALSVLEGGPLSITRAIRLAEHVLAAVTSPEAAEPARERGRR